jgi:hypothetical protein
VTASSRRTVIVGVAAFVVAIILVAAAGTHPGGIVEGARHGSTTSETRTARDQSTSTSTRHTNAQTGSRHRSSNGLNEWIDQLLAYALLLAGLFIGAVVLRFLAARLMGRLPDKQLVLDLDPLHDVDAGREALRREHEAYAAALEAPDVRNGIVACWVLLEATAAGLGVSRRPAETATEFVVRFLHALDVDPRPVAELARLYHEARFSSHDLAPDARSRARAALEDIRQDLDQTAPT